MYAAGLDDKRTAEQKDVRKIASWSWIFCNDVAEMARSKISSLAFKRALRERIRIIVVSRVAFPFIYLPLEKLPSPQAGSKFS